jgi:N-acetylglucosamine-6-phosphate deacetylase
LEGPYFNKAQAGAQDPQYIKNPDPAEYRHVVEYGKGAIVRWSIAPELDGALEMGDYLAGQGILPSIAHSDADYAEVCAARDHHYTLITHLYSGMSTIVRKRGYRHLGVVESAYLLDDMGVEIIADGHHLPPELLRLIVKCKSMDRITLVTDSMRAAGLPDGDSIIGSRKNGQKVIVEGGVAKLMDRTAFAGSVATADRLIRVMVQQAGVDIVDAVRMMTVNPARILGTKCKGSLAVRNDCDLVIFDDGIEVKAVITGGVVRHTHHM